MAVYAIGDVQGCYDSLKALLDRIGFAPGSDTLWFSGDLVNRGPQSLDVLRFVRGLGDSAVTVLGNHDLHLLALAIGAQKKPRRGDTLRQVLDAPDAAELIEWLRGRPFLHEDRAHRTILVHAGIPPSWKPAQAIACADDLRQVMAGGQADALLEILLGKPPCRWSDAQSERARYRFACAALTRIRFVTADGDLDYVDNGPPGSQRDGLRPWFEMLHESWRDTRIVFGHWAALGLLEKHGLICLDSGCVWGRALSAARVDTQHHEPLQWFSVPC